MNIEKTILYRAVRKIWRIFVPYRGHAEQMQINRQHDYEYLVAQGVETEPGNVALYGLPIIHKHPSARIVIGKGVTLISRSEENDAGVNHPVILSAVKPGAAIILHDGVGMSGTSVVAESCIEIGENTMLGANTNVYDTDFHPVKASERLSQESAATKPITIGKNCWIASNATILKGVTIGDGAVVGAMSLVTKNIPSGVIAAGVPAKVIKEIEE